MAFSSLQFDTDGSKYLLLTYIYICYMGGSPGDVSEEPVTSENRNESWSMSCDIDEATEGLDNDCDVGKATEGLENGLYSLSKLTLQLIL